MITYFAGQFLEGAGQLRWLRHWRAVRARVIRNRETVRALARTCGFTYSNCRGRPRAACLCAPRIAALKTRLENDPAVSERAILVWTRSMHPVAPICAFARRLGNAPEWARAEGF